MMRAISVQWGEGLADEDLRRKLCEIETAHATQQALQKSLHKVSQLSNKYSMLCQESRQVALEYISEVQNIGKQAGEKYSVVYKTFCDVLTELQSIRQIELEQMSLLITEPFKECADVKSTPNYPTPNNELLHMMFEARDEYNQSLRKHSILTAKGAAPLKIEQSKSKLVEAKKQFEHVQINFRSQMRELAQFTRLRTLEQLCLFLSAVSSASAQAQSISGSVGKLSRSTLSEIEGERRRATQGWIERRASIRVMPTNHLKRRSKEGYLFKKSIGNVRQRWHMRWFVIKDGVLSWYKQWKTMKEKDSVALSTCSVRMNEGTTTFMVINPKQTILLRAVTEEAVVEWVQVIQNNIQNVLREELEQVRRRSLRLGMGRQDSLSSVDVSDNPLATLRCVSVENSNCADCNCPEPDWASLTLGVLICMECVACHRNLGTHTSKVKSLTFDMWEPEHLELMSAIGNARANRFWEFRVPDSIEKPQSTTPREERMEFLRAKYEDKSFTPLCSLSPVHLAQQMYESIMQSDLWRLQKLIAQGGDVSAVNEAADGCSLLHFAVRDQNAVAVETLLQHQADLHVANTHGQTPLHFSVLFNAPRCGTLLYKRGANPLAVDDDGLTAVQIAESRNLEWFLTLVGRDQSATREKRSSTQLMDRDENSQKKGRDRSGTDIANLSLAESSVVDAQEEESIMPPLKSGKPVLKRKSQLLRKRTKSPSPSGKRTKSPESQRPTAHTDSFVPAHVPSAQSVNSGLSRSNSTLDEVPPHLRQLYGRLGGHATSVRSHGSLTSGSQWRTSVALRKPRQLEHRSSRTVFLRGASQSNGLGNESDSSTAMTTVGNNMSGSQSSLSSLNNSNLGESVNKQAGDEEMVEGEGFRATSVSPNRKDSSSKATNKAFHSVSAGKTKRISLLARSRSSSLAEGNRVRKGEESSSAQHVMNTADSDGSSLSDSKNKNRDETTLADSGSTSPRGPPISGVSLTHLPLVTNESVEEKREETPRSGEIKEMLGGVDASELSKASLVTDDRVVAQLTKPLPIPPSSSVTSGTEDPVAAVTVKVRSVECENAYTTYDSDELSELQQNVYSSDSSKSNLGSHEISLGTSADQGLEETLTAVPKRLSHTNRKLTREISGLEDVEL